MDGSSIRSSLFVRVQILWCTLRVQDWVEVGPRGPNLGWLDQKMGPISDSS